ncbi:conserved hypothetical protein, partial [Ricinus communis]
EVPDQRAPPEQPAHRGGRPPGASGQPPVRGQRFRHPGADPGQEQHPGHGEHREHQPPGTQPDDRPAENRGQHRRGRPDHAQRGQPASRARAGEQIADHRPTEDDPRAARHPLAQPGEVEHREVRGERAHHGKDREQRGAGEQQPTAAERVADRAEHELPRRESDETR